MLFYIGIIFSLLGQIVCYHVMRPALYCRNNVVSVVKIDKSAKSYNKMVTRKDGAEVSVSWNISSFRNDGAIAKIFVNKRIVWSQQVKASSGEVKFPMKKGGQYEMHMELCKKKNCTSSQRINLVVCDTDGSHMPPLPYTIQEKNKPYMQTSRKIVAGYFTEWGVYGKKFTVDKIPIPNLTHLIYSFIPICGDEIINESEKELEGFEKLQLSCKDRHDFTVTILDLWAAVQMSQKGVDSKDEPYMGSFGQLMAAKRARPGLKVLLSVGGWTLSDPFFYMDDFYKRSTFVNSVKDFFKTWKFFDGIDIDWEYPGGGGANKKLGNKARDGKTYLNLLKKLRHTLDELSKETGKRYELTSAISGNCKMINLVNYKAVQKYVNHLFVISFDFFGSWSLSNIGHISALHAPGWSRTETRTIDYAVNCLLKQGVHPRKIVIGVPMFGRGWAGIYNYTDRNPFTGRASAPIKGTWEEGIIDYRQIDKDINNWDYTFDTNAQVPFLFKPRTGELITYDNPRSIEHKGKYVKKMNLGGLFAWPLDADNGDILNAMNSALGNLLAFESC